MKCFVNAFFGLVRCTREERNMRVHLCFAFYVLIACLVTDISPARCAAVLLCVALVISLECVNTAFERLCDAVHPEKSPGIRAAKDAAAGAVLFAAVLSAATGCIIFFRKECIATVLSFIAKYPALVVLIILSLYPAIIFVTFDFKGENK